MTLVLKDLALLYICLLFSGFSNVCHFTCIWPRALKLGCITNVDMLFLTNGFTCLFYENKFMLISGGHISGRSIVCKVAGGRHSAIVMWMVEMLQKSKSNSLLWLYKPWLYKLVQILYNETHDEWNNRHARRVPYYYTYLKTSDWKVEGRSKIKAMPSSSVIQLCKQNTVVCKALWVFVGRASRIIWIQ